MSNTMKLPKDGRELTNQEHDTYFRVKRGAEPDDKVCEKCFTYFDYGALELNDPMPAHWQERADELGCTVALVKYIDELETRVRFLEDLPTLKAEGLVE